MEIELEKELYTVGEVAKILGVNYYTVYNWIREGKIKAVQFVNRGWYRIPREEVERLLNPEKSKN